jgi:hypothetical protein
VAGVSLPVGVHIRKVVVKNRVTLVDLKGPTCIHIEAEITDTGDLLLSGQDLGDAPRTFFGDSDYEYWLRIAAHDKDRMLLALLESRFAGNESSVSELQAYLKSRDIPCEFCSYA